MKDPIAASLANAGPSASPAVSLPSSISAPSAPKLSPAVSQPRDDTGKFAPKPPLVPTRERPTIDARRVLGLKEAPSKTSARLVKNLQDSRKPDTLDMLESDRLIPQPKNDEPTPAAPLVAADAPVAPASAPEPVAPAAPSKVKIGDKEYTPEELAAHLKELSDLKAAPPPPPQAQPAPEPDPDPEPQVAATPPPTPEEIAKREAEWIANTSQQLDAPMTEQEVDTLLAGGEPAVKLMRSLRQRDMATSILQARKGIADALNPVIENIFKSLEPVLSQHETLQRYTVEQQFVHKHKDFAPHVDLARQVGEYLTKQYPDRVGKMSTEQFIDEVARQTDGILTAQWKRFNPSGGTWRDANKPATPTPVVAAPAPAPAPTAPPTPPPAKPLVGNPPQAAARQNLSWNQQVANSMRG